MTLSFFFLALVRLFLQQHLPELNHRLEVSTKEQWFTRCSLYGGENVRQAQTNFVARTRHKAFLAKL
jgi:hypothetical protein